MWREISLFIGFVAIVAAAEDNLDQICKDSSKVDANVVLSCCNITNNLDNKQVIAKCETLYIDKDASGSTLNTTLSPEVQCFSECIFNETGVLKDNVLQIDEAKKSFIKGFNNDKDWAPVVANAVTECESKTKKISSDKVSTVKNGFCTDFSILYLGCMDIELFKNCPASKWNPGNNDACKDLKTYSQKCR